MRVLIVEDEGLVAADLARRIAGFGYEVVGTAATAAEALEAARETRPDMVLMDVSLAGAGDGATAAIELRSNFDIPSVFLTGHSDRQTIERCRQASPLGYIIKPYHATLEVTLLMACQQLLLIRGREQAFHQRDRANARVASILRNSVDGVIGLDPLGRILLFNPRAEAMFGRSEQSALGKTLAGFLIERDISRRSSERHSGSLPPKLLARPKWRYQGLRGDGKEFPIELVVSKNPEGEDPAYTAIVRDVSEQERLQEQFIRAQKMEAVALLSSHVMHDFNNLLLALRASLYLVRDFVHEEGKSSLEDCEAVLEQGAALTRSLLGFSAVRRREVSTFSLRKELEEVVGFAKRLLPKEIRLERSYPEAELNVRMGTGELTQVLMNLIINARDAIPASGGTIRVAVELREEGWCGVVVSDDGEGMPRGVSERAFDDFFTTKPPGLGTGLGLPSVRHIAMAAGGTVHLHSAVGKGTSVEVRLPLQLQGGKAAGRASRRGLQEPVSVACEDERVSRWLVRVLDDSGYCPLVAASREETLQHVRAGAARLVVTDLRCWTGGNERLLQAEVCSPQLPGGVLVLSSDMEVEALDGVRYLEKPFSSVDLLREVRCALDVGPCNCERAIAPRGEA